METQFLAFTIIFIGYAMAIVSRLDRIAKALEQKK